MTLRECIQLHETAQATRGDRPVRIIRAVAMRTSYWRKDAALLTKVEPRGLRLDLIERSDVHQMRQLAATGEHFRLAVVGRVVEDSPCRPTR